MDPKTYYLALSLDRGDGRPVTHTFETVLNFNPADLPDGDSKDLDSETRTNFVRRCLDNLGYKFPVGAKVRCEMKIYASAEARDAALSPDLVLMN